MSLFSRDPAETPGNPTEPSARPPLDLQQPVALATATFALG
jgi:hypothetical protein